MTNLLVQIDSLSLTRFHVEEEGKGVDAAGAKVKADKEAVTKFRQSLRFNKLLMIERLVGTLHMFGPILVGRSFLSGSWLTSTSTMPLAPPTELIPGELYFEIAVVREERVW